MTTRGAAGGAVRVGPPLPVDTLGVWESTISLPEQLRAAAESPPMEKGLGARQVPTAVVLVGLGDGGLAAEAVQAVAGPELAVPVTQVGSGRLPPFVGPRTLVLALSWSGETAETVAAATAARRAGATLVAVSAGGRLGAVGGRAGSTVVPLPEGLAAGRCALGVMTVSALRALEAAGLVRGTRRRVLAAAGHLGRRRDELVAPGSEAELLARRIGRTFPLVHGSAGVAAVAAHRWARQVNLNAKSPAFWSALPELVHGELAGWGQDGDVTRQVLTLVTLRTPGESRRTSRAFDLVAAALDEVLADMVEVRAAGGDDLSRLFELVLLGDLVSLHLAGREGVDPGPVPVVDDTLGTLGRR